MPQPQAADLLPVTLAGRLGLDAGLEWTPTLTVWAGWPRPWWPQLDGAFVEASEVVDRVADDGRRRGDGAPVLVVHSTPAYAQRCVGLGCRMLSVGMDVWALQKGLKTVDAEYVQVFDAVAVK